MTVLANRAKMTVASVASSGLGVITLGSAVTGAQGGQTFAAAGVANGDVVSYTAEDPSGVWEIGRGTYASSGTTLTRTTILASSNGGTAVALTAAAVVTAALLKEDLSDARTLTGKLTTLVSSSTGAGVNLPPGSSPSSPVDGDFWYVAGTGPVFRSLSTNNILFHNNNLPQVTQAEAEAGTGTAVRIWTPQRWSQAFVKASAFIETASTSAALEAGKSYRLTARITGGTLPASPGAGGGVIEIETATDATTNYHTFTPNGAETVKVGGSTGSPWRFDAAIGTIVRLIPVAGGWEQGR